MLITLQSNSDSDASDFTNYFKETVVIPANSEVALTNICYRFENSFVIVAGVNDEYTLKFADDDDVLTGTVVAGSYTPDEFLDALNASLVIAMADAPYKIQQLFPPSGLAWSYTSSSKNQLQLQLVYNPQAWDDARVVDTADTDIVRKEAVTTEMDISADGPGNILSEGTAGTTGNGIHVFSAGDGSVKHYLWGTADDVTGSPHGHFIFRAGQTNVFSSVGIYDQATVPTAWGVGAVGNNFSAGIVLFTNGKFRLAERDSSGTFQQITATIDYSFNDKFEIRVDRTTPGTGANVRYFQNDVEITSFTGGAERFVYTTTTKFGCAGTLADPTVEQKIINATPATFTTSSLDDSIVIIDSVGSGYLDQEKGTLSNTLGTAVEVMIFANAQGELEDFSVIEEDSTGFVQGDICTITGSVSGANNASIEAQVTDSMEISTPGGGYSPGAGELRNGANKVCDINILSVDGSGGVTDFTMSGFVAEQNTGLQGATLSIVGGAGSAGEVTVNATWSSYPSLQDVRWTTTFFGDDPLKEDKDSVYRSSTQFFRDITGMPLSSASEDTTHTITGSAGIGTDRETCTMLVNLDQLDIKSICKDGGVQKTIASVPYGAMSPSLDPTSADPVKVDGTFYHEAYNVIYHKLDNAQPVNHNELRIRLTDGVGNPISQLKHPTTITLDIRPKTK